MAFGTAWLWLALRPVAAGEQAGRPLGLWGALAGLVALATHSVMATVIEFLTLGRFSAVPTSLLLLILALVVLILCGAVSRQRCLACSCASCCCCS